jgi:hypothetical protein
LVKRGGVVPELSLLSPRSCWSLGPCQCLGAERTAALLAGLVLTLQKPDMGNWSPPWGLGAAVPLSDLLLESPLPSSEEGAPLAVLPWPAPGMAPCEPTLVPQ